MCCTIRHGGRQKSPNCLETSAVRWRFGAAVDTCGVVIVEDVLCRPRLRLRARLRPLSFLSSPAERRAQHATTGNVRRRFTAQIALVPERERRLNESAQLPHRDSVSETEIGTKYTYRHKREPRLRNKAKKERQGPFKRAKDLVALRRANLCLCFSVKGKEGGWATGTVMNLAKHSKPPSALIRRSL